MNIQENIIYLAQSNARKCRPLRLEDVDTTIPYFSIEKNQFGKYEVLGFNYEHHDNAPRMNLWESYLRSMIFPNIDPTVDISGYYNIELHDSYTYLNNGKDYKNVLTFAKFKDDFDPVLIPDPYMICNYGNALSSIQDDLDWMKKANKVCFYGTTTGVRDPTKNERIDLCLWARDKRDYCDFYITKIAQMSESDCLKVDGFQNVYRPPVSIVDQLKYKYHLAMDGNTCRFDVWYYKTNNIVMKYQSKEMLWYYPLLQEDVHFVEVHKHDLKNKMDFYNNNPQNAYCMIYNAKKMANVLFRPIIHQMYTIHLFESIAENK